MKNDIYSEFLKQRHRFTKKLLWIGPLVTLLLVIMLMQGRYLMEGAYNWWYTMILPGSLAMLLSFSVSAEKKYNHHGLFAVCPEKGRLWLAQIIVNSVMLLGMNMIFYLVVAGACLFFGISAPLTDMLLACLVLFLTFLWQIPVFMWMSERVGSILSIIVCLLCNIGFGVLFAPTKLWYVPFAIPARLMCPIIKVMPNGLPLKTADLLCDKSVIGVGLFITIGLYLIFAILTTASFWRREVR